MTHSEHDRLLVKHALEHNDLRALRVLLAVDNHRNGQHPSEGPTIEFAGRVRRGTVWTLRAGQREYEIYVSHAGVSVRIWDRKEGRELT